VAVLKDTEYMLSDVLVLSKGLLFPGYKYHLSGHKHEHHHHLVSVLFDSAASATFALALAVAS